MKEYADVNHYVRLTVNDNPKVYEVRISAVLDKMTEIADQFADEADELRDLLRQFNSLFATHFTEGKPITDLISEDDLLELLRKTRQALDGE